MPAAPCLSMLACARAPVCETVGARLNLRLVPLQASDTARAIARRSRTVTAFFLPQDGVALQVAGHKWATA